MSTIVTLYIHHHGDLTSPPSIKYIGGRVDVIPDFDTDLLSFRDLDEFAEKYSYDPSSLVYFKADGTSFKKGVRIIYDDDTVREMVEIHKPYGQISLYLDHFDLDNLIDKPDSPIQGSNKELEDGVGNKGNNDDDDDPEYLEETESDSDTDSDTGSCYIDTDFGHELLRINPGNTVKIATTRLNETDVVKFKRIYVCYHALKEGWKAGCRPGSICRKEGHKKNTCPMRSQIPVVQDEIDPHFGEPLMEPYERDVPVMTIPNEPPQVEANASTVVTTGSQKKKPKEIRRQKLKFKKPRPAAKLVNEAPQKANEPPFQFPKKKLPLLPDNCESGKDHCLTGNSSRVLEEALRGPLGHEAVFKPHPAQLPFRAGGSTPSQSTTTQVKRNEVPSQSSMSSTATRKSSRIMAKGQFKFKNSEKEPVTLGDD